MFDLYLLATDRYHFFNIDIFNFSPIFGQLPLFHRPPIPIFQNLLTGIFPTKYFGWSWCGLLEAPTYGSL